MNIIEYKYSNITLKIRGPGFNNILSPNFYSNCYPDEIYINGIRNHSINFSYYFNETINTVKLKWNTNNIYSCFNMFKQCSNITAIDLSGFDTSKVIDMESMFYNCSQISSLNLSNFNTSKLNI